MSLDTELNRIRSRLVANRGRWLLIAAEADVDRKTLYRIVSVADYNPSVHTLMEISRAITVVREQYRKPAKAG